MTLQAIPLTFKYRDIKTPIWYLPIYNHTSNALTHCL